MIIGTPGAAYGPGFSMSRPVLGKGNIGQRADLSTQMKGRPPVQLPTRTLFDPTVSTREYLNRLVSLKMAPKPSNTISPLMAAHAALGAPQLAPVPLPLAQRPDVVNAAWGEPGGPRPEPTPPPTGLWRSSPGHITQRNVGDLLARTRIVRKVRS